MSRISDIVDKAVVFCRENDKPNHTPLFRVTLHKHDKQKVETKHLRTLRGNARGLEPLDPERRLAICEDTIEEKYGAGDYTVRVEVSRRGGGTAGEHVQWTLFNTMRFQTPKGPSKDKIA